MEGINTSVTPAFFHASCSLSNSNNDNSPAHQVTVDQSAEKCGRPSRSNRENDPKNVEKMDPKIMKRLITSRNYSKKYRMRQMEYIMHLETEVKALQAEVTINSPRINYAERQNALLRVENNSIKQKLSSCNAQLMLKEAQYEELKRERGILRQICAAKRQQAQIARGSLRMRNDAPDYQVTRDGIIGGKRVDHPLQVTDMGGWNQLMLMGPYPYGILEEPARIDQNMGQNFYGASASGIVSESSNKQKG